MTMLPGDVLNEGFRLWLEEFNGAFRPVVRPDPLRTSIRSAATIHGWLTNVRDGQPMAPGQRRRDQAVVDCREPMGLLEGTGNAPVLTDLGSRVLERWDALSLVDTRPSHEIARWAVLVLAGLSDPRPDVRAKYWPMYAAWENLARHPNPGYWLHSDVYRLHLPYYLARPDSRGYSPWTVFVALHDGEIGDTSEWRSLAASSWAGATPLDNLMKTIGSFRPGGALNFRRGLEVVRASRHQDKSLPDLLTDWQVPT